MKWLLKFVDLLLYGNFWIAAAAIAMCWQTQWIFLSGQYADNLAGFIFSATLFLYALHRLVGLQKVAAFTDQGRFKVIYRFRSHIAVYALIAAIASFVFFILLPFPTQLWVLVPGILSLGYVLPVLAKRRRLRDLHFVKIFLIALVWSWITVFLPALQWGLGSQIPIWLTGIERLCFIFAITLPFDIRDLQVDASTDVKTLPAFLGPTGTKILAATALLIMSAMVGLNLHLDAYPLSTALALILSALVAYVLIHFSYRVKHDYYYTGLLDGLMILQFLLVRWSMVW